MKTIDLVGPFNTGSFQLGVLVVLISPGNGNGSPAQGAIWASEESLSTWFDHRDQWETGPSTAGPRMRARD